MINRQLGLSYCGNMPDLYEEVLAEFVEESHQQMDLLREKMATGDWSGFTTLVHALKGTSLTIGAEALSACAKNMQLASAEGRYHDVEQGFGELETRMAEVWTALAEG